MNAKGLLKLSAVALLVIGVMIAYGCASNDEIYAMPDCKTDYMYLKLCSTPKTSLLSNVQTLSANIKRSITGRMTSLTKSDLNYMASLSDKEFTSLSRRVHRLINDDQKVEIKEITDRNILNTYLVMGGATGVERYTEFAKAYIHTDGGLEALKAIMPRRLTDAQSVYYVAMAMYVDNIARPTLKAMLGNDFDNKDTTKSNAVFTAENRLTMLGINLCVDALVDIISDYTDLRGAELAATATFAELTNIWINYQNDNQCWNKGWNI